MRVLPDISDLGDMDALVIRTDYDDEHAWHAVQAALAKPAKLDDKETTYTAHIVNDLSWAGAAVDDVLAALATDDYLPVVFLADRMTMQADHHALLAVTTATREKLLDDEEYEAITEFGREFRTVPMGVHEIHANLALANMDFAEFSATAHDDPEGVFRSWWYQDSYGATG